MADFLLKMWLSWKQVEDENIMWEAMAERSQSSAKEILGTSRGGGGGIKRAWW